LPDIEKINNVAVADISKLDSITFADGQKVNNQDVSLVTDAHTFIADNSSDTTDLSSIDFTSGIDSTYDVYEFIFTNINPANDSVDFTFQVNATDGADYNDSLITSTFLAFYHDEPTDTGAGGGYDTGRDAVQLDEPVKLASYVGNAADEGVSGKLTLYAPSSTTYVKHFHGQFSTSAGHNQEYNTHVAGYINDTTDIDDIRFKMSAGNLDGLIEMYGLAKS